MTIRFLRPTIVLAAVLTLFPAIAAHAGLTGQPVPPPVMDAKVRNSVRSVQKGEIATGRPALFLAVQTNAASDFTDLVAPVLGDDTTYAGLVSTVEEALTAADTDETRKGFLLYNLARIHLLRAGLIRHGPERRAPLSAAASAADRFSRGLHDPAAWELKGDIAAELGQVDGAIAAYKQMADDGAPGAQVQFKTGWAYERSNRMPQAESAYNAAALAQSTTGAGGPQLRHLIYQGLTRTALAQGNDPAALAALARSAKVGQDDTTPFRYKMDAATRLLQRGYAREVFAYAKAAVAASPDDADAIDLRDKAAAALRRH